MKLCLTILAAVISFISAGLWLWSALIRPAYPFAYASGPSAELVARVNFQSKLNALAAATTGFSVLLQGLTVFLA